MGIEDEVLGTLNLLQMDLGVLEGQTSRGLFSKSIFDPSAIGAIVYCSIVCLFSQLCLDFCPFLGDTLLEIPLELDEFD